MTKKNIFDYGSEFAKAASNSAGDWIWSLDTSDMTLVELEEYKKELQRLEEQARYRRGRNVRLLIYAVVLLALIIGIGSIPGTMQAKQGPVILMPMSSGFFYGKPIEEYGYSENTIKRVGPHSFQLYFEVGYDSDYRYYSDYLDDNKETRRVTGKICEDPERLNRKAKSSVTYSDGTTGAVWYKVRRDYDDVCLMVEYKGNRYGYVWASVSDYSAWLRRN